MPFEPLETFYDEQLTLPVAPGKTYVIPSPNADTGLQVQKLTVIGQKAAQKEQLTDEDMHFLEAMPELDDEELLRRVLSAEVLEQMRADGVSWHARQLVVGTVMHWVAFGREAAEEFWEAGRSGPKSEPEPIKPQDHKKPVKKRSSASSTRKSSGNPAKRATAARSKSGARSSTTGP
jgi:hypothetical protein